MPNKVSKISDDVFLVSDDEKVLYKVINNAFELSERFDDNYFKLDIGNDSAMIEYVDAGLKVINSAESTTEEPIKIFFAKYRKSECGWSPVVFHSIYDGDAQVELNEWVFVYSNDIYSVYRQYSTTLPVTFPLSGDLPPTVNAPFVKYNKFSNVFSKKFCSFDNTTLTVEQIDTQGEDLWVVEDLGDDCNVTYIKSTPVGCDNTIPNVDDLDIETLCPCMEDVSSSSQSSSSQDDSSSLSESFLSSLSDESSSINSSSSEEILAPQDLDIIYLRIAGTPFNDNQFILFKSVVGDDIKWSSSSHASKNKTTGTISIYMNRFGRFSIELNATVNEKVIVVGRSDLSNIKNENFAPFTSFLKGFGQIDPDKIFTKPSIDGIMYSDFQCFVSHENMEKPGAANKKINEIYKDYEKNEMEIIEDATNIILYIGKPSTSITASCGAWGFFCLENTVDGNWQYSNGNESIILSHGDAGDWLLTRRYNISLNNTETISARIDYKSVSVDASDLDDNFTSLSVIERNNIIGGSSSDDCGITDTLLAFYSSDDCLQNQNYNPYTGNLKVTLSGGGWNGKLTYLLSAQNISKHLTVWSSSTASSNNSHEYAVLFTKDGINWKLNIGNRNNVTKKDYLLSEFSSNNQDGTDFKSMIAKVHKSQVILDGSWGSGEVSVLITKE